MVLCVNVNINKIEILYNKYYYNYYYCTLRLMTVNTLLQIIQASRSTSVTHTGVSPLTVGSII
jgi:hypothetical protein